MMRQVGTRFGDMGSAPVTIGGLPIATGVGSGSSWKVNVARNCSGSDGKTTLAVGVNGGLSLFIVEDASSELL
jgi:hypothetical protein